MDKRAIKDEVMGNIETHKESLFELADFIWHHPEYNYQEFESSKAVADLLFKNGFEIKENLCEIETAFEATYDSGKEGPHLAFLAEYDAVPGMGHACGHNLMAAMSVGAGIAVKSVIDQLGGKISVFGTPAEEGGGGKVVMLNRGAFYHIDAAMIIHSANETVVNDLSYSTTDIKIEYYGKASHAATWPEEGVSALDPLLMVFQYISQKRLQWNGKGTILGVISEGGESPIYVPDYCQGKFTVRSFDKLYKEKLLKELISVCESIGQITGTVFKYEYDGYTYETIRNNKVLENLLEANLTELGEKVMPRKKELGIGSTDVGNITHELPALQSYVKVVPDLRGHTQAFEEACGSKSGHRAILVGAKAMAMTAVDLLTSKDTMSAVKEAFLQMKKEYEGEV